VLLVPSGHLLDCSFFFCFCFRFHYLAFLSLLYFPCFARDGPNGETDERNATQRTKPTYTAKRSEVAIRALALIARLVRSTFFSSSLRPPQIVRPSSSDIYLLT
jgi:hypothetical protein